MWNRVNVRVISLISPRFTILHVKESQRPQKYSALSKPNYEITECLRKCCLVPESIISLNFAGNSLVLKLFFYLSCEAANVRTNVQLLWRFAQAQLAPYNFQEVSKKIALLKATIKKEIHERTCASSRRQFARLLKESWLCWASLTEAVRSVLIIKSICQWNIERYHCFCDMIYMNTEMI